MTPRRLPRPSSRALVALLVFVTTFFFQFVTVGIPNDQFVHVSRAQQILLGDVPVRDFFDPGMILQYYASAAALVLSGHNLFGEAILTSFFIALGPTLTFLLAARLSGSWVIGAASAALVFVLVPRPYSYPKAFLYVLALNVGWRYAHALATRHLTALAGITAVAFLLRHDHGAYIGLFAVALIAFLYLRDPLRGLVAMGRYGTLTVVFLLPFWVFIQSTVGLSAYVRSVDRPARELSALHFNRLPVRLDVSAPLAIVSPPSERRVSVNWSNVWQEDRGERETAYGLTRPVWREGSNWTYVPTDTRTETLGALVQDPDVVDTGGIDRHSYTLAEEPVWTKMVRRFPVLRTQLLPSVVTPGNALAWLYYLFLVVPVASAVCLLVAVRRRHIAAPEAAFVAAATLLSFVAFQTLVRGSPDSRLADVAGLVCVMAAWTVGRGLGWRAPGRRVSGWGAGAATAVWLVTFWAASLDADLLDRVRKTGVLGGPRGVVDQLAEVSRDRRLRPIDSWHYDPGLGALTRYLLECTVPTDRLFVTWFAPEVFFFAERSFAGGQVYLHPGWHAAPDDQRLTVDRLERQRVPIVLSLADETAFARSFPLVHDHVMRHYRLVGESTFGGAQRYAVRVDRRITASATYEALALPCYR